MLYLDHAATTPLRPAAREAWLEASELLNAGGQYALGRRARSALDQAREDIADCLGCEPIEVIFTASGTEADNLAVQGLFFASSHNRILSSPIEHPAVKETVSALVKHGAEVEFLPVSHTGHVSVTAAVGQPAALVTCMWANNETGAIQPIAELIDAAGANPVHVDAVQAVGHIPVDFHQVGATTLAASAHKFGGPRGVGLLLARRSPALTPVLHGGGQERGIRPGTVDVAGAVATAVALKEATAEMAAERRRLAALRDQLWDVVRQLPDVTLHTHEPALPGHLNFTVSGAEGDSLIMLLDSLQIAASTGSACSNGVNRASEVLLAMGVKEQQARGALRFSLGRTTESVAQLTSVLADVVARARIAGMA
ncbi:cysteine desulfurase family protein [Corynebacterium epidermidicanis]|uniref:Cysteine desulfurase family protein n=1 Tax=Corynebacterium epidermidicanis TaxID=1050174 RepID=A0A0G3GP30_9CORY|nr:cysteine desulfurase family protein [Corynebacterium epidermidicanis]AKK02909.1 cysteine desulfurase family protein [Corynebacterium epidermidicanis]